MWRHTGWRHKNEGIFFFFYICVKLTSKRASEEEKNNENPLFDTTRELWGFKNILAPPPSDP